MTGASEFQTTLRERAARLSRPLAEPPKDLTRVVIFNVGQEQYAVEITNVMEIIRPDMVTRVPGAERYIEGVTNLRGEIVTVVDLKGMLTGDSRERTEESGEMIVCECAGNRLGVLVTKVVGISDIQAGLIDPPLTTLEKLKAEHLIGEFKFEDRIVGLLNANVILRIQGT